MKQIIIPTDNKPGELAKIASLLADKNINIDSIDIQDNDDHGFVTLTVDLYDASLRQLRASGYHPITEDAIVIAVTDEPGALAKVAKRFQDANLNLRSLHILRRCTNVIHVSLVSDDNKTATSLVSDILIP